MKNLIIVMLVAFSFLSYTTQDVKIKGKYKMEYDYSYGSNNGTPAGPSRNNFNG